PRLRSSPISPIGPDNYNLLPPRHLLLAHIFFLRFHHPVLKWPPWLKAVLRRRAASHWRASPPSVVRPQKIKLPQRPMPRIRQASVPLPSWVENYFLTLLPKS